LAHDAGDTIEAPIVAHQRLDLLLLDLRDCQAILEIELTMGAIKVEGA